MASETEIVNYALIEIGQSLITDIDENTAVSRKARYIYNQKRDETIAAGPEKGWKFAKTRVGIAVDSAEPDFGYDYRYAIPDDSLRVVNVSVGDTDLTDWIREGQYILTNDEDEEIDLLYIKQVKETGKFPPYFVRYLALSIALAIARGTAGEDYRLIQKLELDVEAAKINAVGLDEQEKYHSDSSNEWQTEGH